MPNDFVNVEIDLGGALRRLQGLEKRSRDLSTVMSTVAETMLSGVQDNFARREGPGGKPWEPLAKSTKERYQREDVDPLEATLRRTQGGLYPSLQTFSDSDEAGVSTNKRYAAIHAFGGESDMPPGPAAIPARPYLYLTRETQAEIEHDIDHFVSNE